MFRSLLVIVALFCCAQASYNYSANPVKKTNSNQSASMNIMTIDEDISHFSQVNKEATVFLNSGGQILITEDQWPIKISGPHTSICFSNGSATMSFF